MKNNRNQTPETSENNHVLILAGGKGRRLWPVSRKSMPKQFLDFFSIGKTQLQQTWEWACQIVPKENIFISTNKQYGDIVREQLPDAIPHNILIEPVHRNTAPSVAWATYRIIMKNPHGRLLVMHSDQAVIDTEKFRKSIAAAFRHVEKNNSFLTLGVKPSRPEPSYGYLQIGKRIESEGETQIFEMKSFTDKPERKFATMFMESGEFLWNTSMFCANAEYMRDCLKPIFPNVFRSIENKPEYYLTEKELSYIEENFPRLPNISIEEGMLERCDNPQIMIADFGWADFGAWHTIYDALAQNPNDNVSISRNVVYDESRNNIVKLPDDHVAIIGHLDGYIVAEKGNVLLICKKEDSSALVRKYINEVEMEFGEDFV